MPEQRNPRILLVGHGRSGKDTCGEYLEAITGLRFAGTTSKYLTKYVAARLQISEAEAYTTRHENRIQWYEIGNDIRRDDPLKLVRESLEDGSVVGGIRDIREIEAVHRESIVDIVLWIENCRVPADPTLTFGKEWAHVIIENNGAVREFYSKLYKFAEFSGLIHAIPNTRDEVFWSKVAIGSRDNCWLWQGHIKTNHYGCYKRKGHETSAHRYAYEQANGKIDDGLLCLHTCDVRACVNPWHLYLGTHEENARDREQRDRGNRMFGEDNPAAKLSANQVEEIRLLYASGNYFQKDLAKQFGVRQSAISRIVNQLRRSFG